MKVLVLSASPRREGNSWALAQSLAKGAEEAGHTIDFVQLSDYVEAPLGDCRSCRLSDRSCGIADDYERLLFDHVLPADAIVYATPLHFYGMTGRLKSFFDRFFCYTSASSPHTGEVVPGLMHKRAAVLISCEESYRGATLGLEAQFQELTRYLRQDLAGVVVGIGNSRGEVERDPARPLEAAADLGRRLGDAHVTDYRLDTDRSNRVWGPSVEA
ncbi:flavodoxin family protein [Amycolatopsis sp. NPDC051071]|uniref:flavodoxin family protein n=1 Tax=Amycolatopsis sp. NPDC051071 TaxID=3154637 RepID=UPI00342CEF35